MTNRVSNIYFGLESYPKIITTNVEYGQGKNKFSGGSQIPVKFLTPEG